MERGTSRKFAIVALGIMTLALVVVGLVILFQVQQGQDPRDADAFGFGSSAVTTNFEPVDDAFRSTPCSFFLNQIYLENTGITELDQIATKYNDQTPRFTEEEGSTTIYPKDCVILFSDGKSIEFRVKTYAKNATIDATPEALYARVNNLQITSEINSGTINDTIKYFFGGRHGDKAVLTDQCAATIFHIQNDFEYAAIYYDGFTNCNQLVAANQELVRVLAGRIEKIMDPFLVEGYGLISDDSIDSL